MKTRPTFLRFLNDDNILFLLCVILERDCLVWLRCLLCLNGCHWQHQMLWQRYLPMILCNGFGLWIIPSYCAALSHNLLKFFLKMARKRTFSHFFFEKKCVFVPKSFIWLQVGAQVSLHLAWCHLLSPMGGGCASSHPQCQAFGCSSPLWSAIP